MQLTPAQTATLKAFIVGDGTLGPLATAKNYDALAIALNANAAGPYYGIRTDAVKADIANAIQWPKYTPTPAITSANAAQHTACTNACMTKLAVLQILGMAVGVSGVFDATRGTNTNGIKDSTTNLPSAAAFANQDANWTGSSGCVSNQLVRPMTVAEKVFTVVGSVAALTDGVSARGAWNLATGAGNPDMFGPQGAIQPTDLGGILA